MQKVSEEFKFKCEFISDLQCAMKHMIVTARRRPVLRESKVRGKRELHTQYEVDSTAARANLYPGKRDDADS